jgi:hypothetical protein
MDMTRLLINAFVTSKLDYCNSLLYGIPSSQLKKLQFVQNAAARLITKTKKFDHITPALHELHWLPIAKRIEFKLLVITYNIHHDLAPVYLAELVKSYEPTRNLRSKTQLLLQRNPVNLCYGKRSFMNASPTLWNALLLEIRQCRTVTCFKKHLKTHLFNQAYNNF